MNQLRSTSKQRARLAAIQKLDREILEEQLRLRHVFVASFPGERQIKAAQQRNVFPPLSTYELRIANRWPHDAELLQMAAELLEIARRSDPAYEVQRHESA